MKKRNYVIGVKNQEVSKPYKNSFIEIKKCNFAVGA